MGFVRVLNKFNDFSTEPITSQRNNDAVGRGRVALKRATY